MQPNVSSLLQHSNTTHNIPTQHIKACTKRFVPRRSQNIKTHSLLLATHLHLCKLVYPRLRALHPGVGVGAGTGPGVVEVEEEVVVRGGKTRDSRLHRASRQKWRGECDLQARNNGPPTQPSEGGDKGG
jgi:hypothetical protein